MSQIKLWKSIKGFSSQFPLFASLLLNTFIPVAEGVSPIFLFLLSFFMKPDTFVQALVGLEYDVPHILTSVVPETKFLLLTKAVPFTQMASEI